MLPNLSLHNHQLLLDFHELFYSIYEIIILHLYFLFPQKVLIQNFCLLINIFQQVTLLI